MKNKLLTLVEPDFMHDMSKSCCSGTKYVLQHPYLSFKTAGELYVRFDNGSNCAELGFALHMT